MKRRVEFDFIIHPVLGVLFYFCWHEESGFISLFQGVDPGNFTRDEWQEIGEMMRAMRERLMA